MLERHLSFLAVDEQRSLRKAQPRILTIVYHSQPFGELLIAAYPSLGCSASGTPKTVGRRGLGVGRKWIVEVENSNSNFFPLAVAPEVVLCPWRRQTTLTSTSFGKGGREDLETVAVDRKRKRSMGLDANKMSYDCGSRRVCRHPKLFFCAVAYPPILLHMCLSITALDTGGTTQRCARLSPLPMMMSDSLFQRLPTLLDRCGFLPEFVYSVASGGSLIRSSHTIVCFAGDILLELQLNYQQADDAWQYKNYQAHTGERWRKCTMRVWNYRCGTQ
jgi:hypothetical protein